MTTSTIKSKEDATYVVPADALIPLIDNTGTIKKSVNPSQLVEASSDLVANLINHGASGDGVTNDTVAVQAVFDSGANTVIVPLGYVFLCDALTISTSMVLIGGGKILHKSASAAALLTISANDVTVDGVEFDGNRAGNTGLNTVYSSGSRTVVRNCKVHDSSSTGVVFRGGSDCEISHNIIYDCVWAHIIVNGIDAAMSNIRVTDNNIYVSAFGINTNNGGINTTATANSITNLVISKNNINFPVSGSAPINQVLITTFGEVNQYVISNNTLTGGRIGISNAGAHNGLCEGNNVYQPLQIGIEVATGGAYQSDYVSVIGNIIVGSDSGGTTNTKGIAVTSEVATSSTKHIIVSSNIVKDSFLPIQVEESLSGAISDVTVSNNHVTLSSTNSRVEIELVEELTVHGNHIDLNGQTTAIGLSVINCDEFTIKDNYIFNGISGDFGVLVTGTSVDITYGEVKNNSYSGVGTAIAFSGYIRYTGDTNTVDITGTLEVSSNVGQLPTVTDSDNGNPSAAYADYMTLTGTSAITDVLHGYIGKEIIIRSLSTPTITDNAALVLAGGANFVMASTDILVLKMFSSGVWTEVSRSVN